MRPCHVSPDGRRRRRWRASAWRATKCFSIPPKPSANWGCPRRRRSKRWQMQSNGFWPRATPNRERVEVSRSQLGQVIDLPFVSPSPQRQVENFAVSCNLDPHDDFVLSDQFHSADSESLHFAKGFQPFFKMLFALGLGLAGEIAFERFPCLRRKAFGHLFPISFAYCPEPALCRRLGAAKTRILPSLLGYKALHL